MVKNGVCAVVITFRPKVDVLDNLAKELAQVEAMVVVDNGSSAGALGPFRAATGSMGFTLVENGANLGIAAALNIGIKWAEAKGFPWVILFDQDSTVADGLVTAMMAEYAAYPDKEHVAVVVPKYIDKKSGHEMPLFRTKAGDILVVRTSGSLMPTAVFPHIGYLIEDFVIDQVDYEYCLRLGRLGYKIIACKGATLIHSLGEMQRHRVWGLVNIISTHHNARRRYYITRNRLWMARMYWKQYPAYCFDLVAITVKDTVKILLVETPKFEKVMYTLRGVRDALLGRMGKTVEL